MLSSSSRLRTIFTEQIRQCIHFFAKLIGTTQPEVVIHEHCSSFAPPLHTDESIIEEFHTLCKRHVLFHASFALIGLLFVLCSLFLFPLLFTSFLIGIAIALGIFGTLSYCVLRLYFNEQKSAAFIRLCNRHSAQCEEQLKYQNEVQYHSAAANSAYRMAIALTRNELKYHIPIESRWLVSLTSAMSRIAHWHDFHLIKELFLLASINEHIALIKCIPTNLEAHAALANAYIVLSQHYLPPDPQYLFKKHTWLRPSWRPSQKFLKLLEQKFFKTAQLAIEELSILSEYAPHDPWVYEQLAFSYRDLGMPEKEIEQYETLMRLCPEDIDPIYKAGILYFKQGLNAKGLKIYEILKKRNSALAEEVIAYFGAYVRHDPYAAMLA